MQPDIIFFVMKEVTIITDEAVVNKIYFLRGKKIMLDEDLALLYNVEAKRLNEQVKRNVERFPEDFMFQLSIKEALNLKSQIATSSLVHDKVWGGRRKLPYAFTEQGVAMLSSVLSSKTAIEVNIRIIRVFTKIREVLIDNKDILLKIERLEKTLMQQNSKVNKHEKDMQMVFAALRELLNPVQKTRKLIGFKTNTG